MLFRPLKVPPSLLLLLLLLAFFAWRYAQDHNYETPFGTSLVPGGSLSQRQPRIALMTFVTEQRSYLHLSLKNKDHYARRHGYDFIVDYESHTDRAVVFWKFDMAERLIKTGKYDWIWWLDFDTLITNTSIQVTDIIREELMTVENPDEIDFLLTHDCNGFNAGSMLIRGHQRSLKFIRDSWAIHDQARKQDIGMSEQDSTVKLMKDDPISASRVHVVPQIKLNAFPDEIACYDEPRMPWRNGAFVLHFAGAWAHVKGDDPTGQLMNKYGPQVMWGDWREFY